VKKEVEQIIREAGSYLRKSFYSHAFKVRIKKDGSEVTTADIVAQDIIINGLKKEFPEIPIVSEELSFEHNSKIIYGSCFVIDPLDSTKNFIDGIPYFDVSIAYLVKGMPVFGMVYLPILNELFWAEKYKGSYLNNFSIESSGEKYFEGANININMHKLDLYSVEKVIHGLYGKVKAVRHFGCAVAEVCYVAKGSIDGLINQNLSLWDFAACSLILEEAGGVVTNLRGEKLDYSSFGPQTMLASASSELHNKLLRLTKK
jgi:myo-inositol-1(or 4)-monophosphatase